MMDNRENQVSGGLWSEEELFTRLRAAEECARRAMAGENWILWFGNVEGGCRAERPAYEGAEGPGEEMMDNRENQVGGGLWSEEEMSTRFLGAEERAPSSKEMLDRRNDSDGRTDAELVAGVLELAALATAMARGALANTLEESGAMLTGLAWAESALAISAGADVMLADVQLTDGEREMMRSLLAAVDGVGDGHASDPSMGEFAGQGLG